MKRLLVFLSVSGVLFWPRSASVPLGQQLEHKDSSLRSSKNPKFSSIEYYRNLYRETKATLQLPDNKAQIPEWREKVAARLYAALGLPNCQPADLDPRATPLGDRQGYRVERIVYSSEPYADVPGLLLIPDGVSAKNPAPAVLCLHGNVPGAKDELAGETSLNPSAAEGLAMYRDDYAREFAKRGFVTFAIDLRDSGERRHWEKYTGPPGWDWREISGLMAIPLGRTYLGLCVFDAMRALDYLESRPEVKKNTIGCVGFSAGATLTAWLATLDRRVKVAGISGTSTASRERLGPTAHKRQPSGMLPGIYVDLDWDLCIAAMVPTPLVMVSEYLHGPDQAKSSNERIRQAYERFGVADKLKIEYVPRPHVWHGEIVIPWVEERLRSLAKNR
ncbi:MAG: alpha/beta hydrolase family protein [Acidobacteria bacterium]|nr:alpha/beta hydrolase family protein [Acidobacteriota bacterium]MCI0719674.1 alpha/beta hydrolase family protein [Acidobacteriota bacterium]